MSYSAAEVQKAIKTALDANATLTAIVPTTRIRDGAPQDSALPYIDIGEIDSTDNSTKSGTGNEHFLTMHVWSDQSTKQVWDIAQQIAVSIHEQSLSVTGNQLVFIRHSDSRCFRDDISKAWHGIITYRALTYES